MSLFGSSPDDSNLANSQARLQQKSLFNDESNPAIVSNGSIFADDTGDSGASPWNFPTPKKPARSELLKTLLPATDVPETYIDAYDMVLDYGDKLGVGVSLSGIKQILESSNLNSADQAKVLNLVLPHEQEGIGLGRNEFNVLLALIGLSQENEEATLDGVDERRKSLPQPSISYLKQLKSTKASENSTKAKPQQRPATPPQVSKATSLRARETRSNSIDNPEADPWASPAMHKGHAHTNLRESPPKTNGTLAARPIGNGNTGPSRTTSTFTTHSDRPTSISPTSVEVSPPGAAPGNASGGAWGYDNTDSGFSNPDQPGLDPTGFGSRGDEQNNSNRNPAGRSLGGGRTASRGVEEVVSITVLPEKEGMFMFQHRNYEEQELAVWRKQATISVQEEFTGKPLPPGLEDSLPVNLIDTFDTVRAGVKRSADAYISLCNLLERLVKRNQGMAADNLRFSLSLKTLTEESQTTYATDTNDVPLLNEGIVSTAKHLETSQSLLEDEARAWDEGVLEDFKRQRDTLVSVRDMFDRRDRYARDNIPQLERRIENNENKLAGLRSRPEGTLKAGEQEKVEQAILSDKQSIVNQHARGVFIKECIRDELTFFQQSQYHVSKLHQDWSQERVKYAELQADNWRALSEEVENMPIGE
ncbi:Sorting nexin mvp1 [Schaereria dolodes]|nr:Sorting nexin mvp1 [Schaereria dolodes]